MRSFIDRLEIPSRLPMSVTQNGRAYINLPGVISDGPDKIGPISVSDCCPGRIRELVDRRRTGERSLQYCLIRSATPAADRAAMRASPETTPPAVQPRSKSPA